MSEVSLYTRWLLRHKPNVHFLNFNEIKVRLGVGVGGRGLVYG